MKFCKQVEYSSIDEYIKKTSDEDVLMTLAARITILLERLYDEMGVINIDIKPPNMVVKIEDSQQTSAGGVHQQNLERSP